MISGVFNVDKPRGITSHKVVSIVRRVTGIRKVGHAGALDPMATGVLLLCVGRATRVAEYLTRSDKSYQATVRLGVETDTYDADGQVVHTRPVRVGRNEVEAALAEFCGSISQIPPMYSAVKQAGQPLYKLARRGISVERQPRQALISHIALTAWFPPEFSFKVTASAGTYVRSLAYDLGQQLGCGAHLTKLVRTRSGHFELDDAIPLRKLTEGNWQSHLQPMAVAVADFPRVTLSDPEAKQMVRGQSIPLRPEHPQADLVRAHTTDDFFLALIKPSEDGQRWLPHKVFIG